MLAMVEKYLQSILSARSDLDIISLLRRLCTQFGFRSAFIIEYAGPNKMAQHVVDTNSQRSQAWAGYFNSPLHDAQKVAQVFETETIHVVSKNDFTGPDDEARQFCVKNDLLECSIVPIHGSADTVGIVGFSGERKLDRWEELALQLVSYNLFAQTRSLRKVGIATVPKSLTPREKEVMRLSADGYTSQEIAEELGMSARTVNQHVDNVAIKLGTKNRTHAVAEAIRHDLLI